MEEKSWGRNHGGGIMVEESWTMHHGGGIMKHLGDSQKAPRRHPGHRRLQRRPRPGHSNNSLLKWQSCFLRQFHVQCLSVGVILYRFYMDTCSLAAVTDLAYLSRALMQDSQSPLTKDRLENVNNYMCIWLYT